MTERDDEPDWSRTTWDGSRREQLRRWRRMTVRERLAALEQLTEQGARLAAAGRVAKGTDQSRDGNAMAVHETSQRYPSGEPAEGDRVELDGCNPTPLASYLKALGILRLVAEQADSRVRGFWRDECFVLLSDLGRNGVRQFFRDEYTPTPILAPWNGGSGFYASDNKSGIKPLTEAKAERLWPLRTSINFLRSRIDELGLSKKPDGEVKTELMTRVRSEADDEYLDWLDAAVVLAGENPQYPPLLGTGGNDGRLDFTNNFMQRLVEVIDPQTGHLRADAEDDLDAALFGSAAPGLADKAIGQFMPGAAGGPNASTGFEAESLINPWDFILMLEGALLFAATATRRNMQHGEGQFSYPFTVRPTGAGSGAASLADESAARAELWAPLWERPLALRELRALLGEGRATVARRAARDGLDFVRAVAGLGVERGITAFQRYAFMQRSGKAYLATPLNRVPVRRNASAELVDQLESNQFLGRFRRFARSGSNQARELARVLEDRLFELSQPAGGAEQKRPRRTQAVIEALGEIVHYLAASGAAREACPRLPWLDERWVIDADDQTPELRIAASLAGLGGAALPFVCHLLPVRPDRPMEYEEGSHLVTWHHGSLTANLVTALRRRLVEAEKREDLPDKPLGGRPATQPGDLSAFLAGHTDDQRIARLLAGLALVRRPPASLPATEEGSPLPGIYRALKPLFATDAQLRRIGVLGDEEVLPLPQRLSALLHANRVKDAWNVGRRRLHASGLSPAFHDLGDAVVSGPRLLAALALPTPDRDLRNLLDRTRKTDEKESRSREAAGDA